MRIYREEYNAFRTAGILEADKLKFSGEVVHSSKTGLSGELQFCCFPGSIIHGYRHDAIPANIEDKFFIFSGHGIRPEKIVIVQREGEDKWVSPSVEFLTEVHPPWWASVGCVRVPCCDYDRAIAWAHWRRESLHSNNPKRHGVIINYIEVAEELARNGVKAPFFTINGGFIAMPPRDDNVGMVFDVTGRHVEVTNWDEFWAFPRPVSEMTEEAMKFGLIFFNKDPIKTLTIGCRQIIVLQPDHIRVDGIDYYLPCYLSPVHEKEAREYGLEKINDQLFQYKLIPDEGIVRIVIVIKEEL